MADPDDTTVPGGDFAETLPPAPSTPAPAQESKGSTHAPDRLVFFFGGFDPKGARFYHRLFRNGIAQRNATHDQTLAIGKRHRVGRWTSVWPALWRGAPRAGGGRPPTMRTRFHFMRWDDIVRQHWQRGPWRLARDYWHVYAGGALAGVLARIRRQAPAAFGLALFPLNVALLSFVSGLLGVGGALLWTDMLPPLPALLTGLACGVVAWRMIATWIGCERLLRFYGFMREHAIGEVPALDERERPAVPPCLQGLGA
ncbi:MAG: hypothetical protein ABW032_01425 [Burkholderiaceae bacterium]